MATSPARPEAARSQLARIVARTVAGAALGPAVFAGGALRLGAVLLLGVVLGVLGTWLFRRAHPARCAQCSATTGRAAAAPLIRRRPERAVRQAPPAVGRARPSPPGRGPHTLPAGVPATRADPGIAGGRYRVVTSGY